MTEKTLGFEAGTAGDNVTAGAGNVSGLNLVNTNGGSVKYDPAYAFYGGLGLAVTNVGTASLGCIVRAFIEAPGATAVTSVSKMSYTVALTLPAYSTLPTEKKVHWQARLLPSAGGASIYVATDGSVRFQTAGSIDVVTLLTNAQRTALPGRQLRVTLQFDASTGIATTAHTIKMYDNTGTQIGTTITGTHNGAGGSGTAFTGHEAGIITGTTGIQTVGVDHMGLNDGVLVEIPPAASRLTTPVLTISDTVNPTTSSGVNGQVTVTWPNVAGATRYDVYKANSATGTPAQGDFTLLASNVISPYVFTGLGAGRVQLGVKAVA